MNGQKDYEGTYKDGKEDGLHTKWYENGQKKLEVTYKNGEPIDG
jgi:antitoxin component YwqK of YwqJK toxin-antitoxin module